MAVSGARGLVGEGYGVARLASSGRQGHHVGMPCLVGCMALVAPRITIRPSAMVLAVMGLVGLGVLRLVRGARRAATSLPQLRR